MRLDIQDLQVNPTCKLSLEVVLAEVGWGGMTLDPDDPRGKLEQITSRLRAAILTGEYAPGERLPTGKQLETLYGVSRMTISKATNALRAEGLVVSRQGSGVFVRAASTKPVSLRSHLEAAFEAETVEIDFAGFSGETLHGALIEPLAPILHSAG